MSDANVIQCPHCGQAYFVQPQQWAQYLGQAINCTRCGRAFTVTAPGAGTSPVEVAPPGPDAAAGAPQPTFPSPQLLAPPAIPGQGFPTPGFQPPTFPPPYPQFGGGMYPPAPARTSGWAISSLILGILSFCLPVLGSLAAIGAGIAGLTTTRQFSA